MRNKKLMLIILALLLVAGLAVYFFADESNSHYGKLYINEVMANNLYTIRDEDGDYSDYIELYNGYGFDVNLEGYHLSDKEFETGKYTFPNVIIKSHEYLIIFASGKDKYDEYIHTNFKLDDKGEVVTLTDKDNNVISKISYTLTDGSTSYGYNGRQYVYYENGTPGEKNAGSSSRNPIISFKDMPNLKITEYMIDNEAIYDASGDYSSMVEIYNNGKEDVNLEGLLISDNLKKINKMMLPNYIVKSGEYVVIYCSGKDQLTNNEIHTSFKLKEGETLVLSTKNGKIIDSVDVKNIPVNTSYGLIDDTWYYFPTPTFGKVNDTSHFLTLGGGYE